MAAELAYARTVAVLVVVGGLVLGAGLVGGSVLVRRPMARLLEATRRVAMGDLETRIGPVDGSGEIGQLSVAFDEMTAALAEERRRVEQARRQAEHASQSKSDFLAVMSHELKTPLASIISYAELMETDMEAPLGAKQGEFLDRITSSAWHLTGLVEQILEFTRLEAGRVGVHLAPVDIAPVILAAVEEAKPLASAKGLALIAALPDGPIHVRTDQGKLRQILNNLLSNGIKFTHCGVVRVEVTESESHVRIDVHDSGAGIAPENLARIWNTFWQAENPLTRRAGGTGLGLTIVRRLTQLLGGEVLVSSVVDAGSTFTVLLPRHFAKDGGEPQSAEPELLRRA
jgi:two-component system, NtrC family, sensor kinase